METGARQGSGCVVCGGRDPRLLYRWEEGWRVVRCPGCGLLYTDPPPGPEALERYYDGFSRDEARAHERYQPLVRRAVERYVALLRDVLGPGERLARVLDAGGGSGLYARALEALGLETVLADLDPESIAYARDVLGLERVVRADLQRLTEAVDPPFDAVLARHVIEHVPDPRAFVRELAQLVRPGGVCVVETPDAANLEQWVHPRIWGFYWRILRRENPGFGRGRCLALTVGKPLSAATPPKHLFGFDRSTLGRLLVEEGFEVRRVLSTVAGDPVFDPLYYAKAPFAGRGLLGKLYWCWERATSPLVRALGRGSRLVLVCRRSADGAARGGGRGAGAGAGPDAPSTRSPRP